MKTSTASPTRWRKAGGLCAAAGVLLAVLGLCSLFVGKYPLTLEGLLSGEEMQVRVFWTLRFTRMLVGVLGGFALGASGFVYQTVFRNPLASPDVIGVSSGASAGAAVGILFCSGTAAVTACAFGGAIAAVFAALALAALDRSGRGSTIVLAGIAVHALAQTVLICLKLTADPERQLASIEYWIMGSLNGISLHSAALNMALCAVVLVVLFALHRQVILLSAREDEARMLGVPVGRLRLVVLLAATLTVSCVVSLTGLISFIGLLAPHAARLLTRSNRMGTMVLSGLLGGVLLCAADLLARSLAETELPVSIFTSLLGAPFLIWLVVRGRREL